MPEYDPCAKCQCPAQIRGVCQGSPYKPGRCLSAQDHWDAESDRQMRQYNGESYNRQLHDSVRHRSRKRGWRK